MTEPLPLELDNWTPTKEERVYYEHVLTGWTGFLIKRDGKVFVDRGAPSPPMLFRNIEWKPVRELRPITEYHVGKVAFEADKALQFALGKLKDSRRDWQALKQDEKMAWVYGPGPGEGAEPSRKELYAAIRECLKGLVA